MKSSIVNNECVYPRQDKEFDKRVTVTNDDVKEWKQLRKIGFSYGRIAKYAKRQTYLIRIYLIKGEKEKFGSYVKKSNDIKYKTDLEFRKHIKKLVAKNQKKKYEGNIEYRIYQSCHGRCDILKQKYGSLDKYREMRIKMFRYEKENPGISREEKNKKNREIRRKYRI